MGLVIFSVCGCEETADGCAEAGAWQLCGDSLRDIDTLILDMAIMEKYVYQSAMSPFPPVNPLKLTINPIHFPKLNLKLLINPPRNSIKPYPKVPIGSLIFNFIFREPH